MGETAAIAALAAGAGSAGAGAAGAGTAGSLLGGALAGTGGLAAAAAPAASAGLLGTIGGGLSSLGGGILTGAGLGGLASGMGLPASTSGLMGGIGGLVGGGARSLATGMLGGGGGGAGGGAGGAPISIPLGGSPAPPPTIAQNTLWKMAEPGAGPLGGVSAADALAPPVDPLAADPAGAAAPGYGKQLAKSLFNEMMRKGGAAMTKPDEQRRSGSIAPLPMPTLPPMTQFAPPQYPSWARPMTVADLYRGGR